MNSEKKQAFWAKIKTILLALVITFLLFTMVGNSKTKPKQNRPRLQNLEQRAAKLESALRDSRETLAETREANSTLREMLSELRGIHNDCQRNATENFLHPPQQR